MIGKMKRVLAIMLAVILVLTGSFTILPISKAEAATKDSTNGDWSQPYAALYKTEEADLMVRVGDIDNLGFRWQTGYDPFSGNSTQTHSATFPARESNDPRGTDQLMVISAFSYPSLPSRGNHDYIADGYTRSNNYKKGAHPVAPVQIDYDLKNIQVESAILQLFIDDYQPMKPEEVTEIKPRSLKYTVELDGVRAPFIERVINSLNQHGPIGKLISVQIPEEFLPLLKDGRLTIYMDDKTTQNAYGDGAAIDFVKLLINPNQLKKTGTIKGKVLDSSNHNVPLVNVDVTASGVVKTKTNANGEYTLTNVPAGLVVLEASKTDYLPTTKMIEDFAAGTTLSNIDLTLSKRPKNNADLSNLTVNSGSLVPLTPVFDGDITAYDVYLNGNITSVQVTPTSEDNQATITVNGQSHPSGTAKTISIKPGETVVSIVVTAQDGVTTKTYNLKVHTPMTNFEATRSVAPSIVRIGETAAITFTIKPNPIYLDAFGQIPSTTVSGIRPFFLLDNNFSVNTQYDIETELKKIDSKGNSNGGALALGGTGKDNFRDKMDKGYNQTVSVGQTLTSEPSGKISDILDELKDLINKGVSQITIPITDEVKVMQGRDYITVDGFATFRLSLSGEKVKGTYLGSPQIGTPVPTSIEVKNVSYSEIFPSDIQIVEVTSSSISGISGSVINGRYQVNLPNITYTKQGKEFKANEIKFIIKVKTDKSGTYLFNDAMLRYTEQENLTLTNNFNNITLQVNLPSPESVAITPSRETITPGQTVQLSANVLPVLANQNVTWSSSNPTIATVSTDGLVTGVTGGIVTIKATTEDGTKFGEAIVEVKVPVQRVELNRDSIAVEIGQEINLSATIFPADATNKQVTWTSSNTNVATVNTGETNGTTGTVKAQRLGTATITVTTTDGGKTDTCIITVVDRTPPQPPTVNPVTDQDTKVTGTTEPGAKIIVRDEDGKKLGEAIADENGNYTVEIAKQEAGTELSVTATDASGNESRPTTVVVSSTVKTSFEVFYDAEGKEKVEDYNNWLNRPVYIRLTYGAQTDQSYIVSHPKSNFSEKKNYTEMFLLNRDGHNFVEYYESPKDKNRKQAHIKLNLSGLSVSIDGGAINNTTKVVHDIQIKAIYEGGNGKGNGNGNGNGNDNGNGNGNDFDEIDYIQVWTSLSNKKETFNQAEVFYTTPTPNSVNIASVTVYAKAYMKSGRESGVAERTYVFDTIPPSINPGFIKQLKGNSGQIKLETTVNDDGTGSLEVTYRIVKGRADETKDSIVFEKEVKSGHLSKSNGSSNWSVEIKDDYGSKPGYYRVYLKATKTVSVEGKADKVVKVDEKWDVFLISYGYTLAESLIYSEDPSKTTNKPVSISFSQRNHEYLQNQKTFFKLVKGENDDLAEQLAAIYPRQKEGQSIPELGTLKDHRYGIQTIMYAVVKPGTNLEPNHSIWKPLKNTVVVITQPGDWILQIMIVDNNNRNNNTVPGIQQIPSVPIKITSNQKKL